MSSARARRALISCHDKSGVAELGRGLAELGFTLLSTGGTARHLREAGLPVTDVSDVTRFPETLDGRVKTLHPAVHGGLLARTTPEHEKAIADLGIERIDVLAVNLYPFAKVAADPAATFETLIENIDIGGPAMLRSAAKNHESVLVLVDPADYGWVLEALRGGGVGKDRRLELALKVFRHTAAYDAAIAARLGQQVSLPAQLFLPLEKGLPLRYGENPHQAGAFYQEIGRGAGFDVLKAGKELSYNNLLDVDAAATIARDVGGTAAIIIKHGNPCGVAQAEDLAEAYRRARDADADSAFGSIVALTSALDLATAQAIGETFVEVVVAPRIADDARAALASKKNLRLVEIGVLPKRRFEIRAALSGYLVQEPDDTPEPGLVEPPSRVVTRRTPTDAEMRDLCFAWTVCRHVKSNAIVLARDRVTVGVGAGQMSRIDSVRIAVSKASERARGSVLASDAFFPFPDGISAAHDAGITAVVQPGGSMRDAEVLAAADELGVAMIFTGRRHFKH
ncbi:MAG: bifunctional phosphoribosylaminoimidazolecarboxamide formyltransferase/IMP cyclohydrolase [Acidobacteriota bacterium]